MKIRFSLTVLLSSLALALPVAGAHATERDQAAGGAIIGGVAGAVIGHQIRGHDGAVVGGILGAATGAAMASGSRENARRADSRGVSQDDYAYRDYDNDDDLRVRTRVVYEEPVVRERVLYREAPPVVVYRPAPVVVYREAPVYYQPVRQVVRYDVARREWREKHWDKKHLKEHRKWHRRHGGHDRHDD